MVTFAGRSTFQHLVRLVHLNVTLVSQLLDPVSAVEGRTDLLICFDEALQLSRQVFILSDQHTAVIL